MSNQEAGWESVRDQLIIAGISELGQHGITDFSLRRVASACNLSCAAPYKHFKDKEELISAIFSYITEQLRLLLEQVAEVFREDPRRQLSESCIAYLRFSLANPHFRAVLPLSKAELPLSDTIATLLPLCCPAASDRELFARSVALRSFTYGAAFLLENGELANSDSSMELIRSQLSDLLS